MVDNCNRFPTVIITSKDLTLKDFEITFFLSFAQIVNIFPNFTEFSHFKIRFYINILTSTFILQKLKNSNYKIKLFKKITSFYLK
ncbi:hypothetical protein BpHYR1_037775 [Brachionus plicatilis]|uniref:Uncharacterized protein n=1 Tax=Brachionus plicatilis TaxID=10195 RepID=A0A3M7T3W6_BRAPC|nr:hypothetical protein BpHYR1_037775 [Brachionus plicatilis]